jgi:hypothetical protein
MQGIGKILRLCGNNMVAIIVKAALTYSGRPAALEWGAAIATTAYFGVPQSSTCWLSFGAREGWLFGSHGETAMAGAACRSSQRGVILSDGGCRVQPGASPR